MIFFVSFFTRRWSSAESLEKYLQQKNLIWLYLVHRITSIELDWIKIIMHKYKNIFIDDLNAVRS